VWKSNANAMRLLGEEASAAPRKKKNKQKKRKEQASARTDGVLEDGAKGGEADGAKGGEADGEPDVVPEAGCELAVGVPDAAHTGEHARDAADECCVCMDAAKTFMFAPCGHRCACEACAKDVMSTTRECPMCRAAVSSIFKVFL